MRIIRQVLLVFWESFKVALIAFLIVMPIRAFVFQPFIVRGESMEPNIHNNDYLIVDEISYHLHSPQRGDIVVIDNPNNFSQRFIKRIIGLPGETVIIRNGKVMIEKNNKTFILDESSYLPPGTKTPGNIKVVLKKGEYFVLGDNRARSYDSRYFGPIHRNEIVGKLSIRVWPLSAFARSPSY